MFPFIPLLSAFCRKILPEMAMERSKGICNRLKPPINIFHYMCFPFYLKELRCCLRSASFRHKKVSEIAYPDGTHMLLLSRSGTAKFPSQPLDNIPATLWGWNDVKGRRHSSSFFEVADPKFASGKLPLGIGSFLQNNHHS